jgi:Uma2 family endonuclease
MVREVEPSAEPSFPKMTYEQFLRTVSDDVHAEWVDGEVMPMTPVSRTHNELSVFLLALLQALRRSSEPGQNSVRAVSNEDRT